MESFSHKLDNGNVINYVRLESGTCFHAETPRDVMLQLEIARDTGRRLRIFYGDTDTGRDWLSDLDCLGTIGRSTGRIKIPLMIRNARSTGGPAILDHCIVKITWNHKVLYQHPKYHTGELAVVHSPDASEAFPWRVTRDGQDVAGFVSEPKARRFKAFLAGNRNNWSGTAPVPNLSLSRA